MTRSNQALMGGEKDPGLCSSGRGKQKKAKYIGDRHPFSIVADSGIEERRKEKKTVFWEPRPTVFLFLSELLPAPSRLWEGAGHSRTQPTHFLALRKIRIQPEASVQSSGCQESSIARWLRSGCGIMIVKRPSSVVKAVRPPFEPLGFAG